MDAIKEFAVILITAFVAALFLRMLIASFMDLKKRRSSPVKGLTATVLSKQSISGKSEFESSGIRNGKSVYRAVFSTDESEMEFDVSKEEFDRLEEGSVGLLNFKERTFLSFTPDKLSGSVENE